ncbi:MAG: hypothetical protein R6U26_00575 [Candidatus Undinarchaeales archaeon]
MGKYEKYPKEHYERIAYLAERIRELYEKGVDVSSRAIRKSKYAKYYDAARSKEITWTEILVAANVPLDEVMGSKSTATKTKKKKAKKKPKTKKQKKKAKKKHREKKKKIKKELRDAEDTESEMFCPEDGSLYTKFEKINGEFFKYCRKCDKWYHIEK